MSYPNTVSTLPGTWSYLYMPPVTVGGDANGWRSSVVFKTTFANMAAFCEAVAGHPTFIGTSYGGMTRVLSLQHPLYSNLFAVAIDAESFGTPSATSTALADLYSHARVAVTFENPKYAFGTDGGDSAYMSLEIDKGAVYTTVPGRRFAFSGGEPIDQDAGMFVVQNSYTLTLFNCPALDDAAIDYASANPVNSAVFRGKPVGTLLFTGAKASLQVSMAGVVQYQKSYSLTYRAVPWNQAFKRNGTLGTPLDPAGNPQYGTSDLNLLLT